MVPPSSLIVSLLDCELPQGRDGGYIPHTLQSLVRSKYSGNNE